jgi:hypothetical protein
MKEATQTICKYCKHPIIREASGWGFYGENETFHLECLQQNEGTDLI